MRARFVLAFTVLALSAAGLTGCRLLDREIQPVDVLIAADLDLSGPHAATGSAYQRALTLAVGQLNAAGAAGPRKLRLSIRDNQSDSNMSVVNVSEFVRDPGLVALISGPCAACVLANAKSVNARRVLTVALSGADEVNTPVAERRYLFRLGPNAIDDAAALVSALSADGVDNISLLTSDDLYGRAGQQAVVEQADRAGIVVRARTTLNPDTVSQPQPVHTALAERPAALVIWAPPEQSLEVAGTARQVGYRGGLYLDASAAGELFFSDQTEVANDGATLIFPQILATDDLIATTPAKAQRKRWFSDYTARYGGYHSQASFAADAARLLAGAIRQADLTSGDSHGPVDRERVREALETSQVDGLTGPLRFTPTNHSALSSRALTRLVARNGRWRLTSGPTSSGRTA